MSDVGVRALTLVAVIALGYGVKRVGWVKASDFGVLAAIVLRLTLPCALATAFNELTVPPGLLVLSLLGAGVIGLQQVVVLVLDRRRGRQAQAFGVLNVPSYNIGLFAIPYASAFLGSGAILTVVLFDIGNALAVSGIGFGLALGLSRPGRTPWASLLRAVVTSPVFVTYVVLLVLRLGEVSLPGPVLAFTSLVGGANTFLALFMIGVGLEIVLPRHRYAEAWRYLALRYAFAVALALVTWFVVPIDREVAVVLSMLYFAPIASMVPAFTSQAGLDVPTSAFMASVSVLVAIVAMPLVFWLVTGLP